MNNKNQSNLLLPIIVLLLLTISGEAQSNSNFDVAYDRFSDTTTVVTKSVKLLEGKAAENWDQVYVQMYSGYKVKGQYGIIPETVLVNFESFGISTLVGVVPTLNLIVNGQRFSFPLSHKNLSYKCCRELGQITLSFKDYQALVNANSIEMQLGKVELALQPSQIQLLGSLVSDLASKISPPLPPASSSPTYILKSGSDILPPKAESSEEKLAKQKLEGLVGKWKITRKQTPDELYEILKIDNDYFLAPVGGEEDLTWLFPITIQNGKIVFEINIFRIKNREIIINRYYVDSIDSTSIKGRYYAKNSVGNNTVNFLATRY
jgi:hypothetical protein